MEVPPPPPKPETMPAAQKMSRIARGMKRRWRRGMKMRKRPARVMPPPRGSHPDGAGVVDCARPPLGAVMVRLVLCGPALEGVRVGGAKMQVDPAGRPLQEKVM